MLYVLNTWVNNNLILTGPKHTIMPILVDK